MKLYKILCAAAVITASTVTAHAVNPGILYLGAGGGKAYFSVNTLGRRYAELRVEFFDNELSLQPVAEVDLLPLLQDNGGNVDRLVEFPVEGVTPQSIYRIHHRYADQTEVTAGNYTNGECDIVYWSDCMGIQRASGSSLYANGGMLDAPVSGANNGRLRIAGQEYAKGISLPNGSSLTNNNGSQHMQGFVRFKADYGFQYDSPNATSGTATFLMASDHTAGNVRILTETATPNIKKIDVAISSNPSSYNSNMIATKPVSFWLGREGKEVTIGAARFYTASYLPQRAQQTISFSNAGGAVPSQTLSVSLDATAQAISPVMYRIVSGAENASLVDGHILVPTHGRSGNVTVEAYNMGDAQYAPASAQITFTVNRMPWAKYLSSHKAEDGADIHYLTVNTAGVPLAELRFEALHELSLETLDNIDLLPLLKANGGTAEEVIEWRYTMPEDMIFRLHYRYEGSDVTTVTPYSNGVNDIVYWTDALGIQRASSSSWNSAGGIADRPASGANNGRLRIANQEYAKGVCIPNGSNFKNNNGSQHLRGFVRFKADYGLQYGASGSDSGEGTFLVANGGTRILTGSAVPTVRKLDIPVSSAGASYNANLNEGTELSFWNGQQGKEIVVGAPRFYKAPAVKGTAQSIQWHTEQQLEKIRPCVVTMDATSTSGLTLCYRVIRGGEYARIIDRNKLEIYNIPADRDVIVVEAWQPGSMEYAPSENAVCTFTLTRALVVQATEKVTLDTDETLQQITVYGNRQSVGQVMVDRAMVTAHRLVLKYTFVPGEWNYMAFASDINLDRNTDLAAKGCTYEIRSYNTRRASEDPEASPWDAVTTSLLEGGRGYIVRIAESAGTEPVEITFTTDNVNLDFESAIRPLALTLDMSQVRPNTTQDVYVKALGVNSNTLKVKVKFVPEDPESLPVNHQAALEDMRVTMDKGCTAMRLTLPNQDEARVAIFDRKGRRLLKAVRYVSPFAIDIADLKPGTYRMAVSYGAASTTRTIDIKRH